MSTYQVIKNEQQTVFESNSPFEASSIQKKLAKHAQRQRTNVNHEIVPPVCSDCECPILDGWCCQCEPE